MIELVKKSLVQGEAMNTEQIISAVMWLTGKQYINKMFVTSIESCKVSKHGVLEP